MGSARREITSVTVSMRVGARGASREERARLLSRDAREIAPSDEGDRELEPSVSSGRWRGTRAIVVVAVAASLALSAAVGFKVEGGSRLLAMLGQGAQQTPCDYATTFCQMVEQDEVGEDPLSTCCFLTQQVATQRDCLCNPSDYGVNQGENSTASLGAVKKSLHRKERLGARRDISSLGQAHHFQSPGCNTTGYCDTEHSDDNVASMCCHLGSSASEMADCLCNPTAYV